MSIEYTSQDLTRLLVGLISLELAFAAAYLLVYAEPGVPWDIARLLFDLDGEESLTAWFSTVQLFTVGLVLLLAALANEHEEDVPSIFLAVGGLLFVFLSADEGALIHERFSRIITERAPTLTPIPPWIIIYGVLGTILFAVATPYLITLGKRFPQESLIALGGAGAFVGGAGGLEIISKLFFDLESTPTLLKLGIAIEEFLEMAGVSLLLYATLGVSARLCSPPSTQEPLAHQ